MTMMRWNPNSELSDLFENLFGNNPREEMKQRNYECAPSTNIIENKDGFELQMAVPGFQKKDVKISLEKNVLTITSEKEAEKQTDDVKFARREFVYGTFSRSFTLPDTIDVENIKADFKDGILKVSLPKMEEVKISKEIKIA
jgi:HSP20 family protein